MRIAKIVLGTIAIGTIAFIIAKVLKKDEAPTGDYYTRDTVLYDEDEEVLGV